MKILKMYSEGGNIRSSEHYSRHKETFRAYHIHGVALRFANKLLDVRLASSKLDVTMCSRDEKF